MNLDISDLEIIPQNNDVGGGKITKQEIDIIKDFPNAKSLKISGLNQETFEYLIGHYGQQFERIYFFKNKLVSDLFMLKDLKNLKYVYYFFNQRVTKLWDMTNNENLLGLELYDFSKLHSIEGIEKAPHLEHFSIGDEVWANTKIESLRPLIHSAVTHFEWWGKSVLDGDFRCLSQSKIRELDLNVGHFAMDELAKIVASIPNLQGAATRPYREGSITENGIKTTYYYLCKGKRTLTQGKDDAKLQKYVEEFNKLVKDYAERSL